MPRLKAGVIVRVHDLFLPRNHPKEWVAVKRRFRAGQYLLQAFLALNRDCQMLWAGHYPQLRHRDRLEAAPPSYQ